tara:strand:+ start:372 stop:731 length:360 start_codon:yes stop_codon:yes gene_type:complete
MGHLSFILPESFKRATLRVELAQLEHVAQVVRSDSPDGQTKTLSENQKIGVFRRGERRGERRRRRGERYLLTFLPPFSTLRDVPVVMNAVIVKTGGTRKGFVAMRALWHWPYKSGMGVD